MAWPKALEHQIQRRPRRVIAACNDFKLNFGRKIWDTGRSSFHSRWTPTVSISLAPTSLTAWETWNVYGTKQNHPWASLSLKNLENAAFVKLFPDLISGKVGDDDGEAWWVLNGFSRMIGCLVYSVRVMEFLKAARMCLPAWADPNMCCSKWHRSCCKSCAAKHVQENMKHPVEFHCSFPLMRFGQSRKIFLHHPKCQRSLKGLEG